MPERESPLVNWTLSLPPDKSTDSNELKLRLVSSVPWLVPVSTSTLSAEDVVRVSLPLPPTRLSKPLTVPLIPVVPFAPVDVALLRLTVTALL